MISLWRRRHWAILGVLLWTAGETRAQDVLQQAGLTEAIAGAGPLDVELMAVTPVRSIGMGEPMWAPNPDGKSVDLVLLYYDTTLRDSWIVIIDFGDDSIRTIKHPQYINWHLVWENAAVVAPNGRLYFSVTAPASENGQEGYSQQLCMYDPATNQLHMRAAKIPFDLKGGVHPMTLGSDGKLCMAGFHPSLSASAAVVDPDTLEVDFFGAVGPSHAPNSAYGYFCAADERYVYVASGKIPWYLVAHNRMTGESKVLMTTDNQGIIYISHQREKDRMLINVRGHRVLGAQTDPVHGWLKDGRLLLCESEDQVVPPEAFHHNPHPQLPHTPELFLENAIPTSEGKAEIWARSIEARAAAGENPPDGATPGDLGWNRYGFEIEPHPQTIIRIRELPDGRIFGTAGDYQGNFIFDPATGKAEHLGKIHLSHYATTFADNKIYMSGYPSSPLFVYDLTNPWNAGLVGMSRPGGPKSLPKDHPDSNPRQVTLLMEKTGAHKMYAGATGADGKVYFGGRWYRNGSGGGFGWWDTAAATSGGFWEVFSNYQITHMTSADDGRYIVISARRKQDEILKKPTPNEGALFIFETAKGLIVRQDRPVLDVIGPGPVAAVGPRVIGWTQPMGQTQTSIIWAINAASGEVLYRRQIPFPLPLKLGSNQRENFDFRLGPEGRIWTFMAFEDPASLSHGHLVKIDPADGSVDVVGKLRHGGRLAFSGNDIYLSGYPQMRRIKHILPGKQQIQE